MYNEQDLLQITYSSMHKYTNIFWEQALRRPGAGLAVCVLQLIVAKCTFESRSGHLVLCHQSFAAYLQLAEAMC